MTTAGNRDRRHPSLDESGHAAALVLGLAFLVVAVAAGCVLEAEAQQYDSSKDFNTLVAAGNTIPYGIWSDGTTMWVVDGGSNDKIYAYNLVSKARDGAKDFNNTLSGAGNTDPRGISSDGTTMWVADEGDAKIYAYNMVSKAHDSAKDFDTADLAAGNTRLRGIWADGATDTMLVADRTPHADRGKIFVYELSSMQRDSTKDIVLNTTITNNNPRGIWSDGTTIWVVDDGDDKIYAYKMSDKSRDDAKDIVLTTGNGAPRGIWSDGNTMWVADYGDGKIYAYMMPVPPPPPQCPEGQTGTPPNCVTPPPPPPPQCPEGQTGTPPNCVTPPPPPPVTERTTTEQTTTETSSVYTPMPPDTTPPVVISVERAGNATTTDRALTWDVTFSERVVIRAAVHTNHTSVANATIPDMGVVRDTILVGVPGAVTGGSISVDLEPPIMSGLLVELVAPDCTRFVISDQTTIFLYKLRQPRDLVGLAGVGVVGQWALHVSDHKAQLSGTLNSWTLMLESDGSIRGSLDAATVPYWYDMLDRESDGAFKGSFGTKHAITQYVAGPGNHTLSLDGYDIRDRFGNPLADSEPEINEPYRVVVAGVRTCPAE